MADMSHQPPHDDTAARLARECVRRINDMRGEFKEEIITETIREATAPDGDLLWSLYVAAAAGDWDLVREKLVARLERAIIAAAGTSPAAASPPAAGRSSSTPPP